ncbi:acetyltransferase [Marmoricola endophyticus]|uniref:Acetyltransferase n=2 Tax=Marmoricola endophyticus TaxID=2040280 RepID=A0A917F0R4_9ACTN|nr:acetyltransferase [Marmoricola endophyticus]
MLPSSPFLALREARDSDAERWLEAARDPVQLSLGLPAFVEPPADTAAVLARFGDLNAALAEGRPGPLVVADAHDDRFLGTVSWRQDVPPPFATADLGYLVHPAERGRGVAAAAIGLLVDWLTGPDGPGMVRVQLDHSTENPASCRVAERAGLEREGVRRSYLPLRDPAAPGGVRRHDVCLHGLVTGG